MKLVRTYYYIQLHLFKLHASLFNSLGKKQLFLCLGKHVFKNILSPHLLKLNLVVDQAVLYVEQIFCQIWKK